jgi:hypothetical protein
MLKMSITFSKTASTQNFLTIRCIVVLFRSSLSGNIFLSASQTAANCFDAKKCSRMHTRSSREYAMFEPAQLWRNWREQRPSNQGYLHANVTWEIGRFGVGYRCYLIFLSQSVIVIGLRFKWYILCNLFRITIGYCHSV